MKKLFIVGFGGFGREVLWLTKRINDAEILAGNTPAWEFCGFIDDNKALHGTTQNGYPVLGGCDYLEHLSEEVFVVIAIGVARTKKAVAEKISAYHHIHFAKLVDPSVILSDHVEIGEGCILCAGTILTVDIILGKHVIINLDCTVGHDVIVGDYVTVYPSANLSGNVTIGEEAELGTGMQIIQGKRIGKQSIIGAGAIVIKDIPDRCTAVGSPATPVKFFD